MIRATNFVSLSTMTPQRNAGRPNGTAIPLSYAVRRDRESPNKRQHPMWQQDAYRMIQRRARAAGHPDQDWQSHVPRYRHHHVPFRPRTVAVRILKEQQHDCAVSTQPAKASSAEFKASICFRIISFSAVRAPSATVPPRSGQSAALTLPMPSSGVRERQCSELSRAPNLLPA
jgi:hypothetical protein